MFFHTRNDSLVPRPAMAGMGSCLHPGGISVRRGRWGCRGQGRRVGEALQMLDIPRCSMVLEYSPTKLGDLWGQCW